MFDLCGGCKSATMEFGGVDGGGGVTDAEELFGKLMMSTLSFLGVVNADK